MDTRRLASRAGSAVVACVGLVPAAGRTAQTPAIQVSPVSLSLQPDQMAATIAVSNSGSDPTTVQIRSFSWNEQGGQDNLVPTDELIVSPPITQIDAGQTQTFRLVLRHPATGAEASYRLLLDQLPASAAPGLVQIAIRLSLPVFAATADNTPARLTWRLERGPAGLSLVGQNLGQQHTRVFTPELHQSDGPALTLETGQTPYILPGMEKHWLITNLTELRPGSRLRLNAKSDTGPVDAELDVPGL